MRRRGYMRPQGTPFADSARNRDSVMSLGSIAHMQYYFARTGLLDGKGGQHAKEREKDLRKRSMNAGKENMEPSIAGTTMDELTLGSLSLHDGASSYAVSEPGQDYSVTESPTELTESGDAWSTAGRSADPPMLPPTVSTYKQKPSYTEPLPDMPVLRRELKEALQDACKVLEETQKNEPASEAAAEGQEVSQSNGFHEIQGLHLLDIITLAIRAAKNYYTAHSNPQRLSSLRSEKRIRADLYKVLDVLKRMALRNFSGGMRMIELTEILLWIESVDQLLRKEEEELEQQETEEREKWVWREGDWSGKDREREWLFLKTCDTNDSPLPQWSEASTEAPQEQPSAFLQALSDGQRLVKLHNAFVARSKRKFGEITTWHTDVAKPYRRAENLRFWVKAAELRWEIKLSVPVMEIVNGSQEAEVWRAFEEAVAKWCQGVRQELTEEWRVEAASEKRRAAPPELKVEVPRDEDVEEVQEATAVAT